MMIIFLGVFKTPEVKEWALSLETQRQETIPHSIPKK